MIFRPAFTVAFPGASELQRVDTRVIDIAGHENVDFTIYVMEIPVVPR